MALAGRHLTTYSDEVFKQEAIAAGVAAYLVKSDLQAADTADVLHAAIENASK